mgnify:CR=1 FL=1
MARASLFASSLFLRARPTFSVPSQLLFTSPIVNGGGIGLRKVSRQRELSNFIFFVFCLHVQQHIDTDRNNESTPFEFTAENYKKVGNKKNKGSLKLTDQMRKG